MKKQKEYCYRYLFFLLFLFLFHSAEAQPSLDCKRFKKGYFIFEVNDDEVYLIKRKRKQQKEIELKSKNQAVTNIKWLSDCVYQLSQEEKTDSLQAINIPIVIRIQSIDGNTYHFISSSFDDFLTFEGSVRKIKRREYQRRVKSIDN